MQTTPADTTQNSAYPFTPPCRAGQVQIQTTAKPVTPFGGVLPFLAWLGRIGLVTRFRASMPFAYTSPNAIPTEHTLLAFLLSVILGGSRFAHCDWLRFDRALHAIMGIDRFPAKDAIRKFFHRFGQGEIEKFWRPLWAWLLALWTQPPKGFTLDLDSTIFQREGHQQGAAKGYNPRRPGRLSHHPLLAVLAEAPLILHAWLRSGNTAASRGVSQFLQEALTLLPAGWRLRCVRADSGFFADSLLTFLESRALPYIIVAKMTFHIKSKLRHLSQWRALDATHSVSEFTGKLHGWTTTRRFLVVRELACEKNDHQTKGRKLLDVPGYTYRVWVSNSDEPAETIWRDYNLRATMEQRIEELKNDLHADGYCTQQFYATEAAFLGVLFSFNLLATFQAQVMSEQGYRQPATLRSAVFIGGAILGRSGQQPVLRVSASWGGAEKHKPMIDKALGSQSTITARLPYPDLPIHYPIRGDPWNQRPIEPGGSEI
jgi:hypothetical protein